MYGTLQGCRALAAVLVVLFHLGGTIALPKYFGVGGFAVPFRFGYAGVELFFVLSGFIIVTVHWRDFGKPERLAGYLKKRAARIYPVYWLVFIAVYAAAQAVPSLRVAMPADMATIARSLLLLPQDPAVVGGTGAPVLIVAWSLQYELYFYALVALAIASRWLGAAVAMFLAWLYLFEPFGTGFPWKFLQADWMLLFALGLAVALLHRRMRPLASPLLVAGAGFLLFFGNGVSEVVNGKGSGYVWHFAYGAGSALLILGLVRAEDAGKTRRLTPRWATALGDASYALYLLHFPLISACCKVAVAVGLSGVAGATIAFLATLIVCVVAALWLHRCVEKPMLDWCKRHLYPSGRMGQAGA